MTDVETAAAAGGPNEEAHAGGGSDDSIAAIRFQRDVALQAGDRETAEQFDALERELYDAGAHVAGADAGAPGGDAADDSAEAAHAPLTADEAAGVFAFLDEVDPEAAASLRAEWGGDAAANLGYAHLWFTTQYTQDERDSMVVTPGLVRMAARMGHRLATDGRAADSHRPASGHNAAVGGATSQGEQVGELHRRREEALRNGDYRRAQELDEQERTAWARFSGDAPIVGRAGRSL